MKSRTIASPDGDKSGPSGRDAARSPDAERPRVRSSTTPQVDARPVADTMRQLQAIMHTRAGLGGQGVVQRCPICNNHECRNGELCGKKDANAVFATPQGPRGDKLQREDVSAADEDAIRAAFAALRIPRTEPVPSSPPQWPPQSPPPSPRPKKQPENRSAEDD